MLDAEGREIVTCTRQDIEELIDKGSIHGGMLPKIRSAIDALADHRRLSQRQESDTRRHVLSKRTRTECTSQPARRSDDEMKARIERHRSERSGRGWTTLESAARAGVGVGRDGRRERVRSIALRFG